MRRLIGRAYSRSLSSEAGQMGAFRTGFDFLDGAFRSDERARLRGLMMIGTTGIAAVSVALASVTLGTSNTAAVADLERENRQVSRLSVELGQLSNTGGLGERELAARLQVLRSQLEQVEREQVQILAVANDMRQVMPPGAQVTSVELRRSDTGVQRLTLQVALDSFSALTPLSSGVDGVWYLSDTTVSWTSGGDRVAVTIRADIDPGLLVGPLPRLQAKLEAALAGVGDPAGASDPAGEDLAGASDRDGEG